MGSRLPLSYPRKTSANSLPLAHSIRRWLEHRSRSLIRVSFSSDSGPASCGHRRCASTCLAAWPPTSCSRTGPCTPGGRMRRATSPRSASRTRRGVSIGPTRKPRRVRCGFCARPRRRIAGDHRHRCQIQRGSQAAPGEARSTPAVSRGRQEVGRLRAGKDRSGRRDRSPGDVARARARAVDAATLEGPLALGSVCGHVSICQFGRRRRLRQVGWPTGRSVELLLADHRSAARREGPADPDNRRAARAIHPGLRPFVGRSYGLTRLQPV